MKMPEDGLWRRVSLHITDARGDLPSSWGTIATPFQPAARWEPMRSGRDTGGSLLLEAAEVGRKSSQERRAHQPPAPRRWFSGFISDAFAWRLRLEMLCRAQWLKESVQYA
jgi:hypothetical protein